MNQTLAGGARPPDTEGAVGHTQFVEVVNQRVVVYIKTGSCKKDGPWRVFRDFRIHL